MSGAGIHHNAKKRNSYATLADQDDVWLPEKLERLMAGIGAASLIYSNAFLIVNEGRELPGSLIATSGVLPVTGTNFSYFVCNSCIIGCTALGRSAPFDTALPIAACETYHDWWLALVASKRLKGQYYRLVRDRGVTFPAMGNRLALTGAETSFLHDMERCGNALLDARPHLSSLARAYRYREILFPAARPLELLVFIASSVIK